MIIVSVEVDKAIYFGAAAFVGMLYGYTERWIATDFPRSFSSWFNYMFGDFSKAIIAIKTMVILCVGAGGFEYLSSLTTMHILGAGAYIGTLVPMTVDKGVSNGKS